MRLLCGHFGELIDIGLLCSEQGGDDPASIVGEQSAVGAGETLLAQTNKPIATKNTKKALCAFGHQQSAYRRCGLSASKIIFCRKPIRGAYEHPEDYRMRGGFYCVFVAIGLLV
jgi:hypothetical protein